MVTICKSPVQMTWYSWSGERRFDGNRESVCINGRYVLLWRRGEWVRAWAVSVSVITPLACSCNSSTNHTHGWKRKAPVQNDAV